VFLEIPSGTYCNSIEIYSVTKYRTCDQYITIVVVDRDERKQMEYER